MKAAVYTRYGPPDVLEVKDLPKPVPGEKEVLIRVHATTVTTADWRARSLSLPPGFGFMGRLVFGISGPRQQVLGMELAGEIEAVGKAVTAFKPGDQVFAYSGGMGCHAEYRCLPDSAPIVLKPSNLSYEEAAGLTFGGHTVLEFFRRGKLQKGEKILINGASGGVGSVAVQIAKHLGAEVTGVCSAANADLVRSLGADKVIDYNRDDFTRNGETYDVIMDTAGTAPFARCKGSLKEGGRLLVVLGGLSDLLRSPLSGIIGSKRIIAVPAIANIDDLRTLARLAESGALRPVIDRSFPLEQIADAHRLVDSGHKKGNVVVTLRAQAAA